MPMEKKSNFRSYRKKRSNYGLATRPVMMTKSVAFKRNNGILNRTFWFKKNGIITTDLNGNSYNVFNTRGLVNPATAPIGFDSLRVLYDQYKVLAICLRLYPANVGIEPDTVLLAQGGLLRGDTAVWSDQRFDTTAQSPTLISQVINVASCRMINSRRPYKRTLFRAKGYTTWGNTQGPATNDSWNGSIEVIINNATAQQAGGTAPVLWYYTLQYKILVRGRTQQ